MPRERADDYDLKVQNILDAAAELFAKTGYSGAKLMDVAKACGASKSMLYHYFPTKDDLLFAMIQEHLNIVIAALEEVSAVAGSAEQRFLTFLQNFVQKSSQTRQRNMVALNEVKYLPRTMQNGVMKLQRRVIDLTVERLTDLNPNLPASAYKPYAMLLLGMLNWTDTWYSARGPIKPQELIERISTLFLHGFLQAR